VLSSVHTLMTEHALLVSQVPLWILFHSVVSDGAKRFAWCRLILSVRVHGHPVVSRFPKCLIASLIGLYRWGELNSWNSPPTLGIMVISLSPKLRVSILFVTLVGSPITWPDLVSFMCRGLVGSPITWPDLVSFMCRGLTSLIVLAPVPMIAIPIIRKTSSQKSWRKAGIVFLNPSHHGVFLLLLLLVILGFVVD
jgi:hypothetical protein